MDKKRQILAMDVGNTTVSFGLFEGKRLKKEWRVATKSLLSSLSSRRWLHGTDPKHLQGMIFCSVVPWATVLLKDSLRPLQPLFPLYIMGENVRCPIPNRYKYPKQVGQDRLVNAYAALKCYGAPAIIVDFGTAITVDLVSRKGEYLGGVIAPGMGISLEALNEKTALLPRVRLHPPSTLLGKDTEGSMLSGTFYGFASLCDGLVVRLRKKYGSKIKAIATGGHSVIISSYCKEINYINPHLTLQGLHLLFEDIFSRL